MIDPQFYDSQATLDQSRPCYIERQADRDLLAAVLEGTYALLLSSRKMGKSSLIERVFDKLRQQPVAFLMARKELRLVHKEVTADEWCYGIARDLVIDARTRCGFVVDPTWQGWWKAEASLAPVERLFAFIREFLLTRSEARWVIALDEIETTIPLPFSDDFFACLRSCVTGQAGDPALRRLTFILAGVTTPSQLIKDSSRTPFNIGRVISIRDFSPQEAAQLLPGLGIEPDEKSPPLLAVLHWTAGHPYLTQRLLKDLAIALQERGVEDASEITDWQVEVTRLVEQRYLRPGVRVTEEHFADIALRRLEECKKQGTAAGFLRRYGQALRGKPLRDEPLSLAMTQLKLSGLVKPAEDGTLVTRNLLYRRVFDQAWVKDEMPATDNRWKWAAVAASFALVVAVGLWFFRFSPMLATRATTEAEIFSAVRAIAFSQSEIPTRERKLLERYTNEEIARSILKGKERIAEVGLTPDQYQSLLKFVGRPQIASELWNDYWHRQTEALQQLATKLATASVNRSEIDKTNTEFRDIATKLQQGLSEGEQIATSIHAVSNKAMTRAVKGLWESINLELRATEKPSEVEINRAITAASSIVATWRALAEVTGALTPLVDDETLKDDFALLIHGPPNQRQAIERADVTTQKALDELLRQSNEISNTGRVVIDLKSERSNAQSRALAAMVLGARSPIAHDMGIIICETLENSQENLDRLSAFGSALASLVSRLDVSDAAPLAARGTEVLVKALESPQEKDSTRLSALGSALASLVTRLDAKDAAPMTARVAEVLAKALESPQEKDSTRLSAFGGVLTSLALRMDAKEAARLAERFATSVESPQEKDSARLSALGGVLASLTARMDAKAAARLATRGAAVLATAMENPQEKDSARLSALGGALASLLARMDAKEAAPLAARGIAVLATALESPQEKEIVRLSELSRVLAMLAARLLDTKEAVRLAERLTAGMESLREIDSARLSAFGGVLVSLTERIDAKDAARLAERFVKAMENTQVKDFARLSELGRVLAMLAARLDAKVAAPLVARGATVLVTAMARERPPEEVSSGLFELGLTLNSLTEKLDAKDAAPLATRLAKELENPREKDPRRRSALGGALASLTVRLDSKVAAPLVARGAAVLTTAMENARDYDSYLLQDLGRALASMATQLDAKDAVPLAERLAKMLKSPQETDPRRLSEFGDVLASVTSRLDAKDAVPLAIRGAAVLISAMENAKEKDLYPLADLGHALHLLTSRLDPKDAVPLLTRSAGVLATAMETMQEKDPYLLSALGTTLSTLTSRLVAKEAAPLAATLAARGAKVLTTALESPQEKDRYRLRAIGNAFGSLVAQLDIKVASSLAERFVKTLESPLENDSYRRLALVNVLASLVARFNADDPVPFATRGAAVLTTAIENFPENDFYQLLKLSRALASLATRLDTKTAASFAIRGATVLVTTIEGVQQHDSYLLSDLGRALDSLTVRLDAKDAAPLLARGAAVLATAMENAQVNDLLFSYQLLTFGEVLASLTARLDAKDAASLAKRGAAVLVTAMVSPPKLDFYRLSELRRLLASLATRLDAKDAAPLAELLANALESPQEGVSSDLLTFGLSFATLIAQVEPKEAATIAGRTATRIQISQNVNSTEMRDRAVVISILAMWMEPTEATEVAGRGAPVLMQAETGKESFDSEHLIHYGFAAASLTARLPPEDAVRFAPQAAAMMTSAFHREADFLNFLMNFRKSMGPNASAYLMRDWTNAVARLQESQPTQREKLSQVLETLRNEQSKQP